MEGRVLMSATLLGTTATDPVLADTQTSVVVASKVKVSDISITRPVDKPSPVLF
jgi:hypothetical protein